MLKKKKSKQNMPDRPSGLQSLKYPPAGHLQGKRAGSAQGLAQGGQSTSRAVESGPGLELELSEGRARPPTLTENRSLEPGWPSLTLTEAGWERRQPTLGKAESKDHSRSSRLWDLEPAGPFGYEAKTFPFAQASLSWVSCQLQLKQ